MTLKILSLCICLLLTTTVLRAQDSSAAKPTEHVLGTISATSPASHTITVKDDKSGAETVISVADTRTLLKVEPGAKDLKNAVRITADDLATGDRVDIRGSKSDAANGISARSVVLMSGRALEQKHQQERQAWQNSTVGTVASVDSADNVVHVNIRTSEGPKDLAVHVTPATEFTRYSPDDPKTPQKSAFAEIRPNDQVRILGQKSADGSSLSADKIYSAAVRTIAATVISISPDGKQLQVKDLQTKQPTTINLSQTSVVRKLDPQFAMVMARRFNPNAGNQNANGAERTPQNSGSSAPQSGEAHQSSAGHQSGSGGWNANGGPDGQRGSGPNGAGTRGGDLSHMLERIPTIAATDLKPGDAIVVWGFAGHDPTTVTASTVLAGVEPVLQSAPLQRGRSLNADWGLDMATPAE